MSGQMRIDAGRVRTIAQSMEVLNSQLRNELNHVKMTVSGLGSVWEGKAANVTMTGFADFSNKYFQTYCKTVENQTKFLRNKVIQSYEARETINQVLADKFR